MSFNNSSGYLKSNRIVYQFETLIPIILNKDLSTIIDKLIQDLNNNIDAKKLLKPCPKCGITPKTPKEIESVFGFRQMKKDNHDSVIRQSYCRKCR